MIAAGIIRAGIAMRQTVKNRPKRETKRWKTSAGRGLAACLLAVCALCGCVGRTEPADSPPVLPAGTEEVTGEVFPRYEVQTVSVSKGKEAVLVQQVMGGGLLVIINRVLREEIPEELLEDPDFVNDGRYAVTEDKIFTLLPDGRRRQGHVCALPELRARYGDGLCDRRRPAAYSERVYQQDGAVE